MPQHAIHSEKVACQVCHSAGPYKSCFNCHIGKDDQGEANKDVIVTEIPAAQ